MDFDDLEDATEAAIAAGEQVVGYVRQNQQPRPGNELPLMKRSKRLPSRTDLPEAVRRKIPPWNGEPDLVRKPVLRLLCVHGVADSYQQDWHLLEMDAPLNIEVAMHEFPGHGSREAEDILGSVDELTDDAFEAFREAMDTGSFALLGHSIGCLVVTKLAKRAKEELGVEPVQVFMVERGACQYPLFTEAGYKMLREDPLPFMQVYQPTVCSFYKSAGATGQRTLDMWQRGWFCENETLEPGYWTFNCPLMAICADASVDMTKPLADVDPFMRWQVESGGKYFNKVDDDDPSKAFFGHFPEWTFAKWEEWTEFKSTFSTLKVRKCDHMTIKSTGHFKTTLWDALKVAIKQWQACDNVE